MNLINLHKSTTFHEARAAAEAEETGGEVEKKSHVLSEASSVDPRKCMSMEMKYSEIHRSVVTRGEDKAARGNTGAEK